MVPLALAPEDTVAGAAHRQAADEFEAQGFAPQKPRKTLFLDPDTFLLDLDTFTGPYYNSFGDGYPSFGPAHPPAGPHPSLLLDLALSQTIPLLDRFSSFCPAASASQFFRQ